MAPIPFLDLDAQYRSIKPEVDAAITGVVESRAFIGGPAMHRFEKAFAEFCGAGHAVGCSSGTSALYMALKAAGVGAGDEVVLPALTFIATAEAVSALGARVVFADVDPRTRCISVAAIEPVLTEKTRAVIPVHLYGRPCDLKDIHALAKRRGFAVVEDAAQAHGARHGDTPVGRGSLAASFSFYPGKNLGAYGDAGAVITDSEEVARLLRLERDHGRTEKYVHRHIGFNHRMDGIQAAVLSVKLERLPRWTALRQAAAARYDELLADLPLRLPARDDTAPSVYHLYVVEHPERDAILDGLRERGIGCGVHYPIALHRQPAYARAGLEEGSLPVSERIARECFSLPVFPEMTEDQSREVAGALREIIAGL